MFKFKRKNKKGFTLTELLIVVLVISVIAAISIPSYKKAVERTRAEQGIVTLQSIAKAQASYNAMRGTYANNMYALPLDLKDKDGKDIEGDTFSDNYFGYTVYGSLLSQSLAKRNGDWNYELAIDYDTGKLYCTPEDNEICKSLGLDVNTKEIPTGSSGGSTEVKCDADTCYLYDGEKFLGKCGFKEDNIHKCESGDKNGFFCTDKECGEYINGVVVEDSICNKEWVNKDGTACAKQTFECYKDKGICVTYKDGEEYETCQINKEGNGCTSYQTKCSKDGICVTTDENGNKVSSCEVFNKVGGGVDEKCAAESGFSGTYCLGDTCYNVENGKETWKCEKSLGTCYDVHSGKDCVANETFTGCKEEGTSSGGSSSTQYQYNCKVDGGGCALYDEDGNKVASCGNISVDKCIEENDLSGTYCEKESCRVFENGKELIKCNKNTGECQFTNGGGTCTANETFTGCKEESGSSSNPYKYECDEYNCYIFDEKGNKVNSCSYSDFECMGKYGVNGVICNNDACYMYEDGKHTWKCLKNDEYCHNSITDEICTPNETFTGCKEEATSTSGLTCEDFTCTDDWGKTCYNNGSGECIKGDGLELACYKEKEECHWYENGKEVGTCAINKTSDGCKEEESGGGVITFDGNNCNDQCVEVFQDGNKIDKCEAEDTGCIAKYGYSGTLVRVNEDGTCTTFVYKEGALSSEKTGRCRQHNGGNGDQY